MDKKEIKRLYKERKPDMGIISFRCIETGEEFLDVSVDTKADINSSTFKLEMGNHRNRRLQKMWKDLGSGAFAVEVVERLPYDDDDRQADYKGQLMILREILKEKNSQAEDM